MKQTPTSANYSIIPPPNFSYIEDSLCRCWQPILPSSITFLQSNSIGCLINVSSKPFDSGIQDYCKEVNIKMINILADSENAPACYKLKEFDQWVSQSIKTILNQCADCNTIIVGSSDTFYDCVLIGCLRRVQEWSFVSILSEFRQNTWPNKLLDFEQYIEHFNVLLIDTQGSIPDHLLTHYHLKAEEVKLIERYSTRNQSSGTIVIDGEELNCKNPKDQSGSILKEDTHNGNDILADQTVIDEMLIKLLFNNRNTLISSSAQYDPALSLINDKDEDD